MLPINENYRLFMVPVAVKSLDIVFRVCAYHALHYKIHQFDISLNHHY